jgi:CheY-like chemotaxis protein
MRIAAHHPIRIGQPDPQEHLPRALPGGGDILLVAATGWGQENDRQLAFEAGFDHHLTKPIDFERLRAILAEPRRTDRQNAI